MLDGTQVTEAAAVTRSMRPASQLVAKLFFTQASDSGQQHSASKSAKETSVHLKS